MKSFNIYFAAVLLATFAAVSAGNAQTALDDYVRLGLENNLVLKQKNISLKQAEQSLQIARSWFLPSVALLADYTHGDGGRSISMPIGDLLNPVYASLNQLTQSDEFPQIANVEQTFFPQNFYDARVRASMPLINSDLHINSKINSQQVLLKGHEVEVYQRDLVRDIKRSYYNYLSALAAVRIYESGVDLVNRNVAINESLLKNGKTLPANLLRAQSEAEQVKAELNSARTAVLSAQKYFNFLLNRDLNSPIDVQIPIDEEISGFPIESTAPRAELRMLQSSLEIQQSLLQRNRLSRLPKVNAFVDVGSQASNWQFDDNSRYYLAGVQLSLPLFQGFRTNTEIRRTKLDYEKSTLDLEQAMAQLTIAADMASENLATARQNFEAASHQVKAARSYFNLIEKGFQQGVNTQVEYIDARNQLTLSELQLNMRQYQMLTAAAQLERETSSYNLPK